MSAIVYGICGWFVFDVFVIALFSGFARQRRLRWALMRADRSRRIAYQDAEGGRWPEERPGAAQPGAARK